MTHFMSSKNDVFLLLYINMFNMFILLLIIIILFFVFNIIIHKYKSINYFNNKINNKKNNMIINHKKNKKNNMIINNKINKMNKINKINNKLEIIKIFIQINGNDVGIITVKLFDKIVPKTCNNFRTLCKRGKYNNCPFHRIIKDFMIQGGDFTKHNGTGGESIYGDTFEDENFIIKHDKPYLLSMANAGPDTNGSQFFITTAPTPHLDNKHVVFGELIDGFDLINILNDINTNYDDKPIDEVMISDVIIDYK